MPNQGMVSAYLLSPQVLDASRQLVVLSGTALITVLLKRSFGAWVIDTGVSLLFHNWREDFRDLHRRGTRQTHVLAAEVACRKLLLLTVEVLARVIEEDDVGLAVLLPPVAHTTILLTHL